MSLFIAVTSSSCIENNLSRNLPKSCCSTSSEISPIRRETVSFDRGMDCNSLAKLSPNIVYTISIAAGKNKLFGNRIVRVHYFVRGGFAGVTAPVQVQSISPLIFRSTGLDSSGVKRGSVAPASCTCGCRVYKETDQMLMFSRSDVTALAHSYRTFPLRKV
ncbi:hypothetical protein TNCV_817161 [Trichonephila clavipes]|nr:hypothetical protein TNCV_817161 [Trichonephila clavipes]